MRTARQEILEKLRSSKNTIDEKPDFYSPVFFDVDKPLELTFKKALELVSGKVDIFSSESELYEYLKDFVSAKSGDDIYCQESYLTERLKINGVKFTIDPTFDGAVQIGITGCEYLIAQTGSVMISSAQIGGRKLFVYPEIHIVIAKKNQLVETLNEAYVGIRERYENKLPSQIVLITGPSRTADIEKTLTLGAHGPKELNVLVY